MCGEAAHYTRQLSFDVDTKGVTPPLPGNTTRTPIMLSGIHMSLQLSPTYGGQATGNIIATTPYQRNGTLRTLYSSVVEEE